jgi:hypothetical protein
MIRQSPGYGHILEAALFASYPESPNFFLGEQSSEARNQGPLDHEPDQERVFLPNRGRLALQLPLENAHRGAV